jgi:hypothetical protein
MLQSYVNLGNAACWTVEVSPQVIINDQTSSGLIKLYLKLVCVRDSAYSYVVLEVEGFKMSRCKSKSFVF